MQLFQSAALRRAISVETIEMSVPSPLPPQIYIVLDIKLCFSITRMIMCNCYINILVTQTASFHLLR